MVPTPWYVGERDRERRPVLNGVVSMGGGVVFLAFWVWEWGEHGAVFALALGVAWMGRGLRLLATERWWRHYDAEKEHGRPPPGYLDGLLPDGSGRS